jgi:hypothetical protein
LIEEVEGFQNGILAKAIFCPDFIIFESLDREMSPLCLAGSIITAIQGELLFPLN